jgi:hypothetical protein
MTYLAGAIGQNSYSRDIPAALPGMRDGTGEVQSLVFLNNAGMTAPTYTITPPATVDTSAAYTISVNGLIKTVTTDASPTTAELGSLLFSALVRDPLIGRLANITLNTSTGVITLVSTTLNEAIALSQTNAGTTTNDLTIANTVAVGTGSNIPVGRAVGTLASYLPDRNGDLPASLINHATNFTFRGFTELRVLERVDNSNSAIAAYKPGQTMSVLTDCGVSRGIWVECVESDIAMTDSCYIAVGAGNEGKVSKTSSSNMNVSTKIKFTSAAVTANGLNVVRVHYRA